MFEIYNEAARRVIFFARYETGEFGGAEIETEHFLLGLIRQDQALLERLAGTPIDAEAIRQQIRDRMPLGEKIPTDVETFSRTVVCASICLRIDSTAA